MEYAMKVSTHEPMDAVEKRLRETLKDHGFGILTEIDVQATLKEKLDLDRPPHRILGACNPQLASQGLDAEPDLGVLLPCNVTLYQQGQETIVSAMKPTAALSLIDNPTVAELAQEAERLVWGAMTTALPDAKRLGGAPETV